MARGGARRGAGRPAGKSANTSPPSTRARARARGGSENQRPWPADKVERWSIDRLIPYAKNARTHSDAHPHSAAEGESLYVIGQCQRDRDQNQARQPEFPGDAANGLVCLLLAESRRCP